MLHKPATFRSILEPTATMELGPGERLVLRALLVLGKYPALAAAAAYALNHYAGLAIPQWAVCSGALATIPLAIALTIEVRSWRVFRATERHGAMLAPKWEGRWPANFDVLKDVLNSFRHGYPGEQVRLG